MRLKRINFCSFYLYGSLVILANLFFSSCQSNKLPEYTELGALRILAVIASSPDAYPGETVTLTPVISDFSGAGLSFQSFGCSDPGVSFGAEASCEAQPDRVNLGSGSITSPGAASSYTGLVSPTVNVAIPANLLASRSPIDQYNGVAYLVTYKLTSTDNREITAFKRILVKANGTPKNQNPQLSDILMNGTALTSVGAGQTVSLAAQFSSGPETYQVMNRDLGFSSREEVYTTTWFISDGKLKNQRSLSTDTVEYQAPDAFPGTRGAFVIGVTRDGRGGEAVVIKSF